MGKLVIISLVIAALAIFLGERMINLRKRCLASRDLIQKHLPNCRPIKSLEYGSEDITILPNGLAIISTGLKYPGMPSYSDGPGKIYSLDLQDSRIKPVELRMDRSFDFDSFNPHGISTLLYDDDTVYIFVVNHPQSKSQVEIFRFVEEENSIVHVKTIKHDLLHSVNDIIAVGVESFYATNDRYFTDSIWRQLEPLLDQPWCNVVYYSPDQVTVVADGYYSANGINISPDKKHIYVVDLMDHNVHVLEKLESNALVPVKTVAVGSLCDNVEVDPETGDLWLGCHPNAWRFFLNTTENPPGSEVIRIQNIHSEKPIVTQVYADDGHVIMGSSVAAPYGGKLLIGTVYHKALCCDLD
ncbi:serum paraoxonase/arylesterase 2-like [Hypomesus transpacificus]|uniref:serum paraoxonase/arylesterase 2-like n=1 Tax=Hypomesus transpacificus TaxID=137520 RepID=UPI001F086C89|nr:serum paraoxonase/arylesterase 2-like [Hypomesus transpacificus]